MLRADCRNFTMSSPKSIRSVFQTSTLSARAGTVSLQRGCSVSLHRVRLDCHASNVFAFGTHESVEVEIRRFGRDAAEYHRHSTLRAPATLDFIGCRIRCQHGASPTPSDQRRCSILLIDRDPVCASSQKIPCTEGAGLPCRVEKVGRLGSVPCQWYTDAI